MIPFFRKIRRQLANDNQFFKYSRYAIGEIVLVVVGILIALQINNWNEAKKNYKIERNFFNVILNDFQRDRTQLGDNIQFYENRIEQLGWLLHKIRHPNENINIVEFGEHIEPLYYDIPPISYSSAYESAKSSGTFENIKNNEILKELTQFYTEFSEIQVLLTSTRRIIESQLEPVMSSIPENYIQISSRSNVLSINQNDNNVFYQFLSEIGDERDIYIDLKSFLQKPELESYIIGDLGRSFNCISNVNSRLLFLEKIEKSIVSYLGEQSAKGNSE